ncbi:phosphatidylinositol-4-phosphate 5-kinase-like protein 1 [Phytophthora boehmeriae]|uniref:Phosphatidylinositol-4-phosphate 5-kinase-like protein 1 n=1 Tax=Phytophthora boehmeriae TaxID=109152 RepID=A0A8T1X4J7_9STRA|nr:phosphatidylinositol-4-phosphate 5-kinase-like protein 1 [Phytophthora boehmeriae]
MLGFQVARCAPRLAPGRCFSATAGIPDLNEKKTDSLYFTTRDHIKGREVLEEFGMVSAVAVRSKSVISDMYVALAGLVGGEAASYTSLMNETVAEAMHRVQYAARAQGATAVINVRFDSNTTMNRLVFGMHCSVICYGTAVRCRPLRELPPVTSPFATAENKQ